MSDSLSIAAVTATLRSLVAKGVEDELPDENDVTTKPLDKARNGSTNQQLNLYLYQTVPNAGLRNMDLPDRTRPGESGHPPLALDLFYLMTAYGEDDDDLKGNGHQLLGKAMSVLHDHPVLGRQEIASALPASNLGEQVERIRITPQPMSLEEMSKLWNTFQTQYRISVAYQVSVVQIESTRPSKTPLPVLARGRNDQGVMTTAEPSPSLAELRLPRGKPGAELGDELIIRGSSLTTNGAIVRFQHPLLDAPVDLPASIRQLAISGSPESALAVTIPSIADDPDAPSKWPIGFYSIVVVMQKPDLPIWTTNALSFALVPTVTLIVPATPPTPPEAVAGDIVVTLNCLPQIRTGQRAELLFGDRIVGEPTITPPVGNSTPSQVEFTVTSVEARDAPYTLRVRVEGVDSIPVDFTKTPPGFNPASQIKVVP